MGGNVRIFRLPEGLLIGFYREMGGFLQEITVPGVDKRFFAYVNPKSDERFKLLSCVRPPKAWGGREDAIVFVDQKTGAERTTKAEFVGYAYQSGENSYVLRG